MSTTTTDLFQQAMDAAEQAHDAQVLAALLTPPATPQEVEIGGEWSLRADVLLNRNASPLRAYRVRVRAVRFEEADDADSPAGYVMISVAVYADVLTAKGEPSKAASARWYPVIGTDLAERMAEHFLGERLTALRSQDV